MYFSTKGTNQVWSIDTAAQTIEILYDPATQPNPELSGVDNVFGPAYRMLFGAGMIDYAPNIGDGRTLIVLDVREDARFRYVELWDTTAPGGGPPDFTSGRLTPGQTLVATRRLGRMVGALDGRRTRVGPDDVSMPLSPIADGPRTTPASR